MVVWIGQWILRRGDRQLATELVKAHGSLQYHRAM